MKLACVLSLCTLLLGCVSATEQTLRKYTGKNISQFISERAYYPEKITDLPNGNKVYLFVAGSGGWVDESGNIHSNVCRAWIETDPTGTIVRWRYENCR